MTDQVAPQQFYLGHIGHVRSKPARHGFTYRVFFLGLDIDNLDRSLHNDKQSRPQWPWLFSVNALNLLSIRLADHGPRNGSALGPWIRDVLINAGLPDECGRTITLHTFPRVFGLGFSPASFWLCRDQEGRLRAMLAEVNNTFGEHHSYLVARSDAGIISAQDQLGAKKVFHVSPFFPVGGQYQFQVKDSVKALQIRIKYSDGKGNNLIAYMQGRAQVMNGNGLWSAFIKHPFQTLTVLSRIHWHALLLWRKGVQLYRKPKPPLEEISVERQ